MPSLMFIARMVTPMIMSVMPMIMHMIMSVVPTHVHIILSQNVLRIMLSVTSTMPIIMTFCYVS